MNLIACSIKSFLSLFAIMRLTGLSTNSPFSILFFFIFLYLFVRLSGKKNQKLNSKSQIKSHLASEQQ